MEFICQLKDGYMFAQIGKDKYAAVHTGYPYPDTKQPSQVGFDELISNLGIKSNPKYTVEYLISLMTPFVSNDMLLSEETLCLLLQTGDPSIIAGREKSRVSVFFDCSFFTIYYIENMNNSAFFTQACEKMTSPDAQGDWCFLVHYHKWKDTLYKPVLVDKFKIAGNKQFDRVFRQVFDVSEEKFAFYYNELYKIIPKLGLQHYFFDKETCVEQFHICSYKAPRAALTDLQTSISCVLSLHSVYSDFDNSDGQIGRALRQVYGFNVIKDQQLRNMITTNSGLGSMQLLALYSCVYNESSSVNKENIAKDIDDVLKEIIRSLGTLFCDLEVGLSSGDDLQFLTSPYLYFMYKHNMFSMDTNYVYSVLAASKSRLSINPKTEKCRVVFNAFKDLNAKYYEKKLLYYFVATKLESAISNGRVTYKDGHSVFSHRNALKTIVPNFDRLVLMGAIDNGMDIPFMLSVRFSFNLAFVGGTSLVPEVLDSALDEMDCFLEEEKSFITLLPFARTDFTKRDDDYYFTLTLFNGHRIVDEEGYYTPRFRDSFLKNVRPVFEMLAIVSCVKVPERGIARLYKDYTREFSYSCGIFSVVLKKRR